MAAIEIAPASSIPGLHVTPTLDDLRNSAQCVEKEVSFHLVHRHDRIDDGEVMMMSDLNTLNGKWIHPMNIHGLDLTNIHGHLFKLGSEGCPQAYKFREGPLPDLEGVSTDFFSELNHYLQANQLSGLLALGVLDNMEGMVEFDLGHNGTVMLKQEQANYGKLIKETEFVYYKGEDGSRQLKGNTQHAETTTPGRHRVFIDSKLENEAELVKALIEQGLIRCGSFYISMVEIVSKAGKA
ncbi:hypothetical protein FANTH_9521 [Fusarium anthophilum]|uniref:Uncharacterized protein n=1 Tax=Fusarium anthophilum TaxID=48485 RepID=A0A8H4Z732_9HYPO|nr:hypothetical protein FANTH_9521 [Fusarium anthophilum]